MFKNEVTKYYVIAEKPVRLGLFRLSFLKGEKYEGYDLTPLFGKWGKGGTQIVPGFNKKQVLVVLSALKQKGINFTMEGNKISTDKGDFQGKEFSTVDGRQMLYTIKFTDWSWSQAEDEQLRLAANVKD